jgi:hypothetical protein
VDRHIRAPSSSTSTPRSFPECPCSSPNIESCTSPPLCQFPPSVAATPVRMRHRPSPRLPSASPRARPCHAGPPSPTDAVIVVPVTPHPPGRFGQRAAPVSCGFGPNSDSGLCAGFIFSFIELAISGKIGYGFKNAYKMKYSSKNAI